MVLSAVGDQVQALENALGVRLLNRTTRRVSLTEIGRGYHERCVQLLQDLEEADEAAGAQQATPRGQLPSIATRASGGSLPRLSAISWPGTRKRRSICAPATR